MSKTHPFHEYPPEGKHLHDGKGASKIVYNAEDEAAAREAGYGDQYIPQEYPKSVGGVTVNNAEEEATALAAPEKPEDPPPLEPQQ